MKVVCLTVGKKHDTLFAPAIEMYQARLQAYTDFAFEYIPVSDKTTESAMILKRLQPTDLVVLLDETGMMITNQELVNILDTAQNTAVKRIVFIIGGAYGVNDSVAQRSDYILSVSGLALPHQLMRLFLTEQLYRSFNTLAGGKYHHS